MFITLSNSFLIILKYIFLRKGPFATAFIYMLSEQTILIILDHAK